MRKSTWWWILMMSTIGGFINPSSGEGAYSRHHICSVFLYTDPYFWRVVYNLENRDYNKTKSRIHRILLSNIQRANDVFEPAEFYGSGNSIHQGIRFVLSDYVIDDDSECFYDVDNPTCFEPNLPMAEMCDAGELKCANKENIFCNRISSLRFYLHGFSAFKDHSPYCLSFGLTYRNLSDFQGIAWIKGFDENEERSFTHYGYCSISDETCKKLPHYYRNTGVVNYYLLNGVYSESAGQNVFVHEIGHSLGSTHDNKASDCNPTGYDLYLMTGNAKKILLEETKDTLSMCSSRQIGRNLDKITCWDRNGTLMVNRSWFKDLFETLFSSSCVSPLCHNSQKSLLIIVSIILTFVLSTSFGLCYCYRQIQIKAKKDYIRAQRNLLLMENEITSMWSVDYGSIYSKFEQEEEEEQNEFFKAYDLTSL